MDDNARYRALCAALEAQLNADGDASDEELLLATPHDGLSVTQARSALAAVRRLRHGRETTPLIHALAEPPVPHQFREAYRALVFAVNGRVDEDRCTQLYEVLTRAEGFTLQVLVAAAYDLSRTRQTMPKLVDWIAECRDEARHATSRTQNVAPLTVSDDGDHAVFCCPVCRDTGWAPQCGDAIDSLELGVCRTHPRVLYDMTYRQAFKPCACRDTNTAYQASREGSESVRGRS